MNRKETCIALYFLHLFKENTKEIGNVNTDFIHIYNRDELVHIAEMLELHLQVSDLESKSKKELVQLIGDDICFLDHFYDQIIDTYDIPRSENPQLNIEEF